MNAAYKLFLKATRPASESSTSTYEAQPTYSMHTVSKAKILPGNKQSIKKHWTHLAEVPDIKQVKGVKQLAVAKAKLVMAHLEECPDVLQTQELQHREDKGWHKTDISRVTSVCLCVMRPGRTADVPVTTRGERERERENKEKD